MESKKIIISNTFSGEGNDVTSAVAEALGKLKKTGGTLSFEKGVYHFFTENALSEFLAVTNNNSGNKKIIFPIFDFNNLTVDGGGSTFIFHSGAFPFAIRNSHNITIKNFRMDTAYPLVAAMEVGKKTSEGFYLKIDKEKFPYHLEKGSLVLESENGDYSGKYRKFSLHRAERSGVQYLFTGNCIDSAENLPARFTRADGEEREEGLFFKYHKNIETHLVFEEKEKLLVEIAGGRDTDLLFFDRCKGCVVENVTVNRGKAMGVLAAFCEDVTVDGFNTDISAHKEYITLTADAIHLVNCSGKVEIKNCNISHTADDAINVHGIYTEVKNLDEKSVTVRLMHQEQYFVNPYFKGDKLRFINPETLEITGSATVEDSQFTDKGKTLKIICKDICGQAGNGYFTENYLRMPDVHIHNNVFTDFPHIRLSGGGKILVENNRIERCGAALCAYDLAQYWYESGRIKELIFRNNILKNCNFKMGKAFINIGVSGFEGEETPVIHEKIEISGNTFKDITHTDIIANGVKELIVKDNIKE